MTIAKVEIRMYRSHVMGQRSLSGFLSFKNNVCMDTAIISFVIKKLHREKDNKISRIALEKKNHNKHIIYQFLNVKDFSSD